MQESKLGAVHFGDGSCLYSMNEKESERVVATIRAGKTREGDLFPQVREKADKAEWRRGKMENDKFQELVIQQFGEIQNQFGKIQNQFGEIHSQFSEIHSQFGKIENQFEKIENQFEKVFEKLDHLEALSMQHHIELELVARQVEILHEEKDISKSKFYLVQVPD